MTQARPSSLTIQLTNTPRYREGSDFVRGYPYSLRKGVATAVSHGLWLHNYDYDAPTQLLKVCTARRGRAQGR